MTYNWQQKEWPEFRYRLAQTTEDDLYAVTEAIGHVNGILTALPKNIQTEAIIEIMVSEAVKTSEIEGEYVNRPDVMSSIRNNLGLNKEHEIIKDRKSQGAGELMVAVRNSFSEALSKETLFAWHRLLMDEQKRIAVGAWRTHKDTMRVISGVLGKEKIHFEAPPSSMVPGEMQEFINWFNDTAPGGEIEIRKAPIRAAIAHLYFESIHPFEDGNGRIGRAVAEKALSQTIGRPILLSLSQTIEADKKSYYQALENAQKSNEITEWINYFILITLTAQKEAIREIEFTLLKAKFFDTFKSLINERQLKAIHKMLENEPKGFEGGMTANKYMSITKSSKATATRDLQLLVELGIMAPRGGGRSTAYTLLLKN